MGMGTKGMTKELVGEVTVVMTMVVVTMLLVIVVSLLSALSALSALSVLAKTAVEFAVLSIVVSVVEDSSRDTPSGVAVVEASGTTVRP